MKLVFACLITIVFSACHHNQLTGKEQAVTFEYISWACECANWIEPDSFKLYQDKPGSKLADKCVFIEPANNTLNLPDTIGYNGDLIEFTGQFYTLKGLPKGYIKTEQPVEDGRIFRYTGYKIIRSNHKAVMKELGK